MAKTRYVVEVEDGNVGSTIRLYIEEKGMTLLTAELVSHDKQQLTFLQVTTRAPKKAGVLEGQTHMPLSGENAA
jgi:hypothetical protein